MQTEQQLQQQVNAELETSLQQLDELTLSKIKAARLKALAQQPKSPWWSSLLAKQAGAAVFCSALVAAVVLQPETKVELDSELALLAAMNPVLSEDPEILQDLDFLLWLEQQQFESNS